MLRTNHTLKRVWLGNSYTCWFFHRTPPASESAGLAQGWFCHWPWADQPWESNLTFLHLQYPHLWCRADSPTLWGVWHLNGISRGAALRKGCYFSSDFLKTGTPCDWCRDGPSAMKSLLVVARPPSFPVRSCESRSLSLLRFYSSSLPCGCCTLRERTPAGPWHAMLATPPLQFYLIFTERP